MSRTYKDKPDKLRHDAWDTDTIKVPAIRTHIIWETKEQVERPCFVSIQLPSTKAKKRKRVDTEWHWMSTPSWWNHIMHTKKRRRKAKLWEASVLKALDLEEVDKPNESNKPHQYFW